MLTEHGQVLVRQHGRDVHARRVVPDEERLVGLLGVVAIEEVDHLGRDFLVHGLRALQRQRALVLAGLVLRRAVGGFARDDRARRGQTGRVLGIDRSGNLGKAGDRGVLAGRRESLVGRRLVDVREAHPLHRVQVIQVTPELVEAVRRRQRVGMVAEMVLAELAGSCSRGRAGTRRAPGSRAAGRTGCPAAAAGSCPCAAGACR